jgi:protein-disulfide isomerase
MRDLIERHADEIRLIHRHYPLDSQCNPTMSRQLHPYACEYSRLAFCAGQQRKFWEANDFLFAKGRRNDKVTARELAGVLELDAGALERCVGGPAAAAAVREDLANGVERNVRGTPTFVLGGRAYPGRIPPDVLAAALSAARK